MSVPKNKFSKVLLLGVLAAISAGLLANVISNYMFSLDIKYNLAVVGKEDLTIGPDTTGNVGDMPKVTNQLHLKSNQELFMLESADKPCEKFNCLSLSGAEVTKMASSIRKNRMDDALLMAAQQQGFSAIINTILAVFSLAVSTIALLRINNT